MASKDLTAFKAGLRAARRKNKTRRKKMTIPVATLMGVGAAMAGPIRAFQTTGDWFVAVDDLSKRMVGFSPREGKVTTDYLAEFWLPVVAGAMGSKAANWLGINQRLARAGVPIVRI